MRLIQRSVALTALILPSALLAQTPTIPPAAEQIAAAVLPLPKEMQGGATVMGYKSGTKLETLRAGNNGMICLALYVTRPDFHVACYHHSLEAFMARGRELRENGVKGTNVDSVRFKEIADGKLKMPKAGALYSLTAGKKEAWDPTKGTVTGASPLSVVYMPFATPDETGISGQPKRTSEPWLMFPGTAKAHIMLVGTMAP